MKKSTFLTEAERVVMVETAAAPQLPGTILRDFEMILDFIGTEGVPVSPKSSEFNLAKLPEINARLVEPGNIGFSRGRQISFPHVDALHLLLRYSHLVRIDRSQSTSRMVVDAALRQRWQALNPSERYFTLLEAWWRFSEDDSESAGFSAASGFDYRVRLLDRLRPSRKSKKFVAKEHESLLYLLGMYQIALLQMFGMVELKQGEVVVGKGWKIERMIATPWGLAACASYKRVFAETYTSFLTALPATNSHSMDSDAEEDEAGQHPFQRWAAEVSPVFPAWKNALGELDAAAAQRGTITFKVSLTKDIWRRIAMPAEYSFADLAMMIITAFNFDDDHLYGFYYHDEYGVKRSLDDHRCEQPMEEYADAVELGRAGLGVKQKIGFIYDFGDEWRFDVLVEKVDESKTIGEPMIIDKAGKSPKQYQWD
ncbi:plasmid pRiA4b ORF-3 family protein [Propionivibrio sp.]|uniref:plasmid pRiA4b ORF-3 family protein n=1 Tax=Propionivibrio sp. TaxID=2212460 RepID=UPI003BEFBA88